MPEISEFDHEFMTAGSQSAEGEKLAGLVQQNLTTEEQRRLEEIMPILEEFNMLIFKAQTGEFPEEAEGMGFTNEQGVPEQDQGNGRVPQDMQSEAKVPPRSVEGQVPQNAPKMQGGGPVPPIIQQQQGPEEVAAGPVGVVDEQGADSSGVADDVPAESDGFVINAAAVKFAGLKDINDMIQNAKEYAERQGIRLNFGKAPVDAEKILVSNGEVVIPDVLANIIGYDKLEKINNRGKKETEQVEEEVKQEQQVASPQERPVEQAKPLVLQGKMGGRVKKPKKNLDDQVSGLT